MSSNWDGQGQYQGAAQNVAAEQSAGDAPRRRYVSLDGAKAALCAFNAEATAERLIGAIEDLLAPLPDGPVKSAIRAALVEGATARLKERHTELNQDLLDAAAFFVR